MKQFLKTISDITEWLNKMKVENYEILPSLEYGFIVNVRGIVILHDKNLSHIPVKFENVSGSFICTHNKLKDLKSCPRIVGRDFHCSHNLLTSLEGCPSIIHSSFRCSDNNLTSLRYAPQNVHGFFDCANNKITSLEFCPETVGGYFSCNDNMLSNLEYSPQSVGGKIYLENNVLLHEAQNINDFNEIKKIHEQYLGIKNEHRLLDNLIQKTKNIQDRSYKI